MGRLWNIFPSGVQHRGNSQFSLSKPYLAESSTRQDIESENVHSYGICLCLGPAFTDHKVQGRTFDQMLANLTKPPRSVALISSLCVVLSRGRWSLEGLANLRPFERSDFVCQVSQHQRVELARWQQDFARTKSNLRYSLWLISRKYSSNWQQKTTKDSESFWKLLRRRTFLLYLHLFRIGFLHIPPPHYVHLVPHLMLRSAQPQ